jgi:hypothetical protein
VIAFLASPAASHATGASWEIDGGVLQMGPMAGSHLASDDWRRGTACPSRCSSPHGRRWGGDRDDSKQPDHPAARA